MYSYEPFWNMLKEKGISTYTLENDYNLNRSEIYRLKHDHNFGISFLDHLCTIFDCEIHDIVKHCVSDVSDSQNRTIQLPLQYTPQSDAATLCSKR